MTITSSRPGGILIFEGGGNASDPTPTLPGRSHRGHGSPSPAYQWRTVYMHTDTLMEASRTTSPRHVGDGHRMPSGSPNKRRRSDGAISHHVEDAPLSKRRRAMTAPVQHGSPPSHGHKRKWNNPCLCHFFPCLSLSLSLSHTHTHTLCVRVCSLSLNRIILGLVYCGSSAN